MFKLTVFLAWVFIVSSVWSSCDSCGSECAASCGTRRFRACCFNYLRRKRAPHAAQLHFKPQGLKENRPMADLLSFIEEDPNADLWMNTEYQPYPPEDMFGNGLN
ncbi:hypothetical protein HW555_003868 [Spodoptera exigua]|uniref:Trissin n=1 Tax=Spodoptera exigua TaxID=7107 RepID=A0A835L6L4_SPOEX|nr:hypothetical protein HW555_003868 [Spodoptera exigua]